jgi:hypothetical protein
MTAVFKGEFCVYSFLKWAREWYANENVIALSHFGSGFDNYFILKSIINDFKASPDTVFKDSKAFWIGFGKMVFLDSFNFIQQPLAGFPKTLGLSLNLKKGDFPHNWNVADKWDYCGAMPTAADFVLGSMKEMKAAAIEEWLASMPSDAVFNFRQQYLDYCLMDVQILQAGCIKFDQLVFGDSDIHPFENSCSIASLAMCVYRKDMAPNSLGFLPREAQDLQSHKALCWLNWLERVEQCTIQHAGNGGEVKIGGFKVDGVRCDENLKEVFEFQGCFWHGHSCMNPNEFNPVAGATFGSLAQKTKRKNDHLKSLGYKITEIYECEYDDLISANAELQAVADFIEAPISLKDCLYGGRVEGLRKEVKLANEDPAMSIKYYDITSLYPYVNKYYAYALGHPIHHPRPETLSEADISILFGACRVTVLPPSDLHIPLLPYRTNKKLLFTQCAACADSESHVCKHSDAERALKGTWCTMELAKAFELGYKLIKVHSCLYWTETAKYGDEKYPKGIFGTYVNKYLKIKTEASGWPAHVITEADKLKYIQKFEKKEDVILDYNNIAYNPGLRFLAKILLNSLWGKFVMRDNLYKTDLIRSTERFNQLVFSGMYKVRAIIPMSEEVIMVEWKHLHRNPKPFKSANTFVGCLTTTWARLYLYSVLERLGSRVIYMDTDSVIFTCLPGEWTPALGDFLGDWTDESPPGSHISHFVHVAPKNYVYTTVEESGVTREHIKVKGISLTRDSALIMQPDAIRTMVNQGTSLSVPQSGMKRHKHDLSITPYTCMKTNRPVLTKRVYSDHDSVPYGSKRPRIT